MATRAGLVEAGFVPTDTTSIPGGSPAATDGSFGAETGIPCSTMTEHWSVSMATSRRVIAASPSGTTSFWIVEYASAARARTRNDVSRQID